MNRRDMMEMLGSGLFGDASDGVMVRLDQPSVGPCAMVAVESAYDGFDWERGKIILMPSEPLVSWSYLERIHPGIRDEIEVERKALLKRPRRVIVAGCRIFGDTDEQREMIKREMEHLAVPAYVPADKVEVVSGCARGVDTVGAEIARELGYSVVEFPADWERHGKVAGMIRNRQMADYASEDMRKWEGMLLAFWDGESRGTANMIEVAEAKGLKVKVVRF